MSTQRNAHSAHFVQVSAYCRRTLAFRGIVMFYFTLRLLLNMSPVALPLSKLLFSVYAGAGQAETPHLESCTVWRSQRIALLSVCSEPTFHCLPSTAPSRERNSNGSSSALTLSSAVKSTLRFLFSFFLSLYLEVFYSHRRTQAIGALE